MTNNEKNKIQLRYYQIPKNAPFLALIGEKWKQNYGRDIDYLHFHNYMEIGYCYKGSGRLILGNEEGRYKSGYFSIIPQKCPHTTNSDPGTFCSWEYLFVDVDETLSKSYQGSLRHSNQTIVSLINAHAFLKPETEKPKLGQIIRNILDIMRRKEEFYLEEATAEVTALLMNIARENKDNKLSNEPPHIETMPISQSLGYISRHYMEPLKIEDIAESCHMSESHFRKIFSKYMSMGPMEYVNMIRIQTACDYLKRTDNFITDIANKCGFPTFSTFSRNFKKVTGVSPNEWRKRPDNYEQQLLKSQIHSEEGW